MVRNVRGQNVCGQETVEARNRVRAAETELKQCTEVAFARACARARARGRGGGGGGGGLQQGGKVAHGWTKQTTRSIEIGLCSYGHSVHRDGP